jgi:phosphoglycerol transferase
MDVMLNGNINIINAFVTFILTIIPLFSYYWRMDKKKLPEYAKTFILVNSLYLLLFSIYKQESIVDTFQYLIAKLNFKFIGISIVIDIIGIVLCRYQKIDFKVKLFPVGSALVLFTSVFLIDASFRFKEMYGVIPIEQLIFHVALSKNGANLSMIKRFVAKPLVDTLVIFISLTGVFSTKIHLHKHNFEFCHPISKKIFIMLFPISSLLILVFSSGLFAYLKSLYEEPSTFYETNYIDPSNIKIIFPENKRNLIVIFVESLETGFLTKENNGAFTENLIPGITALAKNNINFSGNNSLGGAVQVYGTEWTIAGISAQYSGVPLAVSFLNQTEWNNYGELGSEFLPRAYSIGDILHDAGYNNYFILGSDIAFGGRDKYFKTHKDTVIYDYNYFHDNGYIPTNYNVWWGIEDRKLYTFAKEKITDIAINNAPFFITLLTADTHPSDGYLDNVAEIYYDSQYKNVLRDADRQLIAFIDWIKSQNFYQNTTIVIIGDHLYQDSSFFPAEFKIQRLDAKYDKQNITENKTEIYHRFPVNIFVNSLLDETNTKNRNFSHFDIFPALIDSIGGIYDSEGLGLGRSMVKNNQTLLEQMGLNAFSVELKKKSDFYNKLWGEGSK